MNDLKENIRNAIMIVKHRDPQYNFAILERKNNSEFKVEILWTRDESEILTVKLNK